MTQKISAFFTSPFTALRPEFQPFDLEKCPKTKSMSPHTIQNNSSHIQFHFNGMNKIWMYDWNGKRVFSGDFQPINSRFIWYRRFFSRLPLKSIPLNCLFPNINQHYGWRKWEKKNQHPGWAVGWKKRPLKFIWLKNPLLHATFECISILSSIFQMVVIDSIYPTTTLCSCRRRDVFFVYSIHWFSL